MTADNLKYLKGVRVKMLKSEVSKILKNKNGGR